MTKNQGVKAFLDGLIRAQILFWPGVFLVSSYSANFVSGMHIFSFIPGAMVTALVYWLFVYRITDNKTVFLFSLCSTLCFIICTIITVVVYSTFLVPHLHFREVTNADGILLIFVYGGFIFASIVLRTGVLVALSIKNRIRSKRHI